MILESTAHQEQCASLTNPNRGQARKQNLNAMANLPSVEIRRELEIQLQHCLMVVAQRLLDFNPEQHWKLSHMNMRR